MYNSTQKEGNMSGTTKQARTNSTSEDLASSKTSTSSLRSFRRETTNMRASDSIDGYEKFETLEAVSAAIREEGVRECGLIFGIDYTLSNKLQGQKTFGGFNLHDISKDKVNPYQEVICILGETLEPFDNEGMIPAYGFGDRNVKDKGIFPLKKEGRCDGFGEVLEVYEEITPEVKLGGPTNFAPLIDEAVSIVQSKNKFHILVIVADGQVTSEEDTIKSIVRASDNALSIIMIGVGDGPWDVMQDFDTKLPERKFDNFHFVEFHKVKEEARNPQAEIALEALMQIPEQYKTMRELGYL
ncbi:hypothetical protein ACF0H5_022321 [Mactra antiquata]